MKTSSPTVPRRNVYSREYNDTQRSRRSNNTSYNTNQDDNQIPQLNISTTGSEFEQPLQQLNRTTPQNSTRDSRVLFPSSSTKNAFQEKSMEMKCAWCFESNSPHNHPTKDCIFLPKAEATGRWKVAYRNRICTICLEHDHYWKFCKSNTPNCSICGAAHHINLGCRPQEYISTSKRE